RARLETVAYWYPLSPGLLDAAALDTRDIPGAAHAAEHAQIGLLPLFAMCDRWDIGGLSAAWPPDTAAAPPGAPGTAEQGTRAALDPLRAPRDTVASCPCDTGCPSCVQSPKCGNGNNPLDKAGAVRLLDEVLVDLGAVAAAGAAGPVARGAGG